MPFFRKKSLFYFYALKKFALAMDLGNVLNVLSFIEMVASRDKYVTFCTFFYFLTFFWRLPQFILTFSKRKIDRRNILGVRIRFHRASQYYSHGLNMTLQKKSFYWRMKTNPNLNISVNCSHFLLFHLFYSSFLSLSLLLFH